MIIRLPNRLALKLDEHYRQTTIHVNENEYLTIDDIIDMIDPGDGYFVKSKAKWFINKYFKIVKETVLAGFEFEIPYLGTAKIIKGRKVYRKMLEYKRINDGKKISQNLRDHYFTFRILDGLVEEKEFKLKMNRTFKESLFQALTEEGMDYAFVKKNT